MTGIILAGGTGSRMGGKDKALLLFSGETFLRRKIRLLSAFCESLLVVAAAAAAGAAFENLDVPVIRDEAPGIHCIGPLMGLYTGLKHSETDINFVTTVDSPFISGELAAKLRQQAAGFDVFIPMWTGYPEPLFGVYRKTCLPAIERVLSENRRRIVSFYPHITVGYLPEEEVRRFDPQGLSFINVNTEEEYRSLTEKNGPA